MWKKESPNQSRSDDEPIHDTNSPQQDEISKSSYLQQKEEPAGQQDESSVGQELERRARAIVNRGSTWGPSASGTIVRDIALTLDAITDVHAVFDEVEQSLLNAECAAGTELLQAPEPSEPALARLFSIEAERRRNTVARNEQLRVLHRELLVLLNKHAILAFND